MKKYLISFSGHGVESVFMALTENQYSWWFQKSQEEDFSVEEYLIDPEEFDEEIPEEYDILLDDGDYQSWDYNDLIFYQETTPDLDSCYVIIEELNDDSADIEIINMPFMDFIDGNVHIEHNVSSDTNPPKQIMELNSYEKGTIFGAIIETNEFDISKLSFTINDGPNGNEYLCKVVYDGEELINTESSTTGKGMVATIWER
jgi:hypothetical protein